MSPVLTRSSSNVNVNETGELAAQGTAVDDLEGENAGNTEYIIDPNVNTGVNISGQDGEYANSRELPQNPAQPVHPPREPVSNVSENKDIPNDDMDIVSWVQVPNENKVLRNVYSDRATLARLTAQKPHDWPDVDKVPWTRWSKKTLHWLNERGLQWCILDNYNHLSKLANEQSKFEITVTQNALSMLAGPKEDTEILDAISPWDAWQKLESKYKHKSMLRAQELETQIENLTYRNEPIANWFDNIIKIRRELTEIGEEFHMSDKALLNKMFRALPDEFRIELSILRREITKGDCKIDEVRQALMDAELDINRARKSKGVSSINMTSNRGRWHNPRGHGYNHNSQYNNKRFVKEERKCFKCHQPGHIAKNCPQHKKTNLDYPNNVKTHNIVVPIQENKPNEAFAAPAIFDEKDPKALSIGQHQLWILDSGATHHVTGDWNALRDPSEIKVNKHLSLGNNHKLCATHEGNVRISLGEQYCTLKSVLFTSHMAVSLVSVSQLANEGILVTFNNQVAILQDRNGKEVAQAKREGNLYLLGMSIPATVNSYFVGLTMATWHRRLGHLNLQDLKAAEKAVDGMEIKNTNQEESRLCQGCELGKQSRIAFGTDERRAKEPLELIHSDLMEFPVPAIGLSPQHIKDKWAAVFVDDFSRYVYVWITSQKSNVCYAFMRFKAYFEKLLNKSIKILRTDGGTEYMGLKDFLIEHGINHQVTTPYTPQSNGVAERMNRTVAETMRAFLYQFKEPIQIELWGFALLMAAQVRNYCPKRINNNLTPYELFIGKRPNIKYLRMFGCKTYFHVPDETRNKLEPKARIGILVGYQHDMRAYWIWDPLFERVHLSRDAHFDENCTIKIRDNQIMDIPLAVRAQPKLINIEPENPNIDNSLNDIIDKQKDNSNSANSPPLINVPPNRSQSPIELLRRSQRQRKPSYKVKEGALLQLMDISPRAIEPITYEEAIQSKYKYEWVEAMKSELATHLKLQTWDIIDKLPINRKAISSKWHYRIKQGSDGQIIKFKARLVARGFTQIEGEDYNETFAPVMKFQTLRILLALATEYNWHIHQLDVVTAYLNGKLQEEIYMSPPTGYNEILKQLGYLAQPNSILRLRLALYGLKQSGRTWYLTLDQVLTSKLNLTRSIEDECVYFNLQNDTHIIIAIYVDDILIITKQENDINYIKTILQKEFHMTDNGAANWILGIKIDQSEGQLKLSQATHIINILTKFEMLKCRPAPTPLPIGCVQSISSQESKVIDRITYQQAIGSLMYLMVGTRPDIAFAVSFLSQFASNPKQCHWGLVKHVFRYLKGTINFGLIFKQSKIPLIGYSDADYANDKTDRKSFSGFTFCLANAAISWRSHKQSSVSLSTMEAECIALTDTVCEAIWLRRFLKELKMHQLLENDMVRIYCDNCATIEISRNPVFHKRAKHIDVRYRRIREEIERKTISIQYAPSDKLVADALTKPTTGTLFIEQRNALGVKLCQSSTAPLDSGGVGNSNPLVRCVVSETEKGTAHESRKE